MASFYKRSIILCICCLICFSLYVVKYPRKSHEEYKKNQTNITQQLFHHQTCRNVSRPHENDIQYRNGVWQYYIHGIFGLYFLGTYYENRTEACGEHKHCVKTFPTFVFPISENEMDPPCVFPSAMYWYTGQNHPITVKCDCFKKQSARWWRIDGEQYANGIFTCPLPEIDEIPQYVSFTVHSCDRPNTFLKLHVSKGNMPNDDVAVCAKSLFGNWDDTNIAYLATWLEALRIYGVKVVHMSYTSFNMSTLFASVIKDYVDSGFLVFSHIPNYLYETDYYEVDDAASQAVVVSVINHCYGQIWNTYKYVIHIDTDELIVPRLYTTYTGTILAFCNNQTNCEESNSFRFHPANFYRFFPDRNSEAPKYVPILKKLLRTPIEIPFFTWSLKNSHVASKSIVNTRNCFRLHIHVCGSNKKQSVSYLVNPDLAVCHHYRGSCKPEESGTRCRKNIEWKRRIYDPILVSTIGQLLQERVRNVLIKSGYFVE